MHLGPRICGPQHVGRFCISLHATPPVTVTLRPSPSCILFCISLFSRVQTDKLTVTRYEFHIDTHICYKYIHLLFKVMVRFYRVLARKPTKFDSVSFLFIHYVSPVIIFFL